MSATGSEPLRGEAAWKAAKERIAKRNDEAYARGRRERAAIAADAATRRAAAERLDAANRPKQPHRGVG
jgi:hypothetical protein